MDLLRREPNCLPFRPVVIPERVPKEMIEKRDAVVASLLAESEYGSKACVVLNLPKDGERAQREADASYRNDILGFFAEGGVEFFAGMIQSEAYARIAGGKQLGDTLVAASVPLLPRL